MTPRPPSAMSARRGGPRPRPRVHGIDGGPARADHSGCPGSLARNIPREPDAASPAASVKSRLSQWPIQLHLISPLAPYFEGSDLLVAADCTAFALGGFHDSLLKGKKLVIACPKLDETRGLRREVGRADPAERPQVADRGHHDRPLLFGSRAHRQAGRRALPGVPLEVKKVVVGIDGKIVQAA